MRPAWCRTGCSSRKWAAVEHDSEFGMERMVARGRQFVEFAIRCRVYGATQTRRDLSPTRVGKRHTWVRKPEIEMPEGLRGFVC